MSRDADNRGRPAPLPTQDPDEDLNDVSADANDSLMPSANDLRSSDSVSAPTSSTGRILKIGSSAALIQTGIGIDDEEDDEGDDVFVDVEGYSSHDSFDFGVQYMIPLSTTLAREQNEVPKSVSLFTGLGLIIGMCIGSGIFASPGPILARTGSGWAALSVWIAGGGLCLLGSSCYAELGSSIPGNGGEFLYLLKAFGTLPAFLFSWTNITVTRPAAVAVIAVVFGEYATRLMGLESVIATRMIAVFLIWSLTAVNCFSSKLGAIVQDVFTIMKLISLLVIGFVGIRFLFNGQGAHNFDSEALARTSKNPGDYAIALYTALWAYDGWNNLNLVTGELRNPEKNLPRAVTIGPSIVIFCYLLVNVSYYSVLPADLVSKSNSIAVDFGKKVFGPVSSFLIPLIVLGSTLGACNATIFTGSRVTSTSSKHGHSPKFLGTLHTKFRTPVNALILQAVLSSAFCSAASFSPLVTFFSDIAWLFYLLTVASLLRLRVTEPYLERPFRVWIGAPIIFCAVTTGMITLSLIERPVEGLCATLFMLSGVPVWWVAFKSGWTAPDDLQDLMHKVSVPLRILRRNRNGVASASTAWPLGVKKSQQPLSNVPEMSTSTSSEQL